MPRNAFKFVGSGEPFDVLKAECETYAFPRHFHDTYVVQVVESGFDRTTLGKDVLVSGPGAVLVISPGEVHTGVPTDGTLNYRAIYPTRSYVQDLGDDLGLAGELSSGLIPDGQIAAQFLAAHRAYERGDSMEAESGWLDSLAKLLGSRSNHGPRGFGKFAGVVELIHDRYSEPLSLRELADLAGYSRYHFLRAFRDFVGLPPHEYLTSVRVVAAQKLLRGGASVTEAAADVGFADKSHLSRKFKRHFGYLPSDLKRATSFN